MGEKAKPLVGEGITVSELFEQLSAGVRDPMTDNAKVYFGAFQTNPIALNGGIWGEDPDGNRVLLLTEISMQQDGGF